MGKFCGTDVFAYDGSVWTNNFAGVYHMNKAVLAKQTDSAPNANHATDSGFVDGNSTLEVAVRFVHKGPVLQWYDHPCGFAKFSSGRKLHSFFQVLRRRHRAISRMLSLPVVIIVGQP